MFHSASGFQLGRKSTALVLPILATFVASAWWFQRAGVTPKNTIEQ
jgi:hypothetical protein